jgi:outer membrane protein assembly factor BamB
MLAAQDGTTGSGWLTFRGNPAHTGASDLEGPAGPANAIEVKWRWQINGRRDPISASPAVTTDGTVIVGTEGGYIAAIQPEGATNWSMSLDNPILSSPAVDESGNILVVTADGYMYFIAANGATIWKSDFDRNTSSSPVISGSDAYIGTDDDELLTINVSPDMSHSGESKKLPSYVVRKSSFLAKGTVLSSPAVSGSTIFFGGGEYLYALNPNAGNGGGGTGGGGESSTTTTSNSSGGTTVNPVKWWYRANGDIKSSPAISGGKVYVGADDGYLYAFSENTTGMSTAALFPGLETGLNWQVLATNTTNEPLWKRKTGGKIRSSPAVAAPAATFPVITPSAAADRELVYVGSFDGYLYCYDDIGQLKWKFSAGSPIQSSPAVDKNGDIYFGADNGNIYALFSDGALKWVYPTRGPVRSSPAIGPDKRIYVGSDDGYLYCIGESDEETREPDFVIENTASPASIANDDNPTIITAAVTSQSTDPNILTRIASVTADLTPLQLIGWSDPLGTTGEIDITTVSMLDDGTGEDAAARDGIFTFAFGITTIPTAIDYASGIYTYYLPEDLIQVGPVPIMVTVQDIYGHRVSKPFPLNIAQKVTGTLLAETTFTSPIVVNNRLNQQTLDISFTAGRPLILSITPNQGSPGQVQVAILGQNTNFIRNKTRVEIFNEKGFRIAKAEPVAGTDQVVVLSDTSLTAILSILDPSQVTEGTLFDTWDVTVTTEGDIPLVLQNGFTITPSTTSTTAATPAQAALKTLLPFSAAIMTALQTECTYTLDAVNAAGAPADQSPWIFNSDYVRTIAIEQASGGPWSFSLSLGTCAAVTQTFKIVTGGSNNGYVTGQITNGYTSNRIDGVTITALTGEGFGAAGNSTVSSGGGYYMLPLPATRDKYTIIASKDGLVNIKDDVLVTADQETRQDFTLKAELKCPITTTLQRGNLKNFYAMRDRVLLTSPQGQRWVALYYRYASEVTRIILANASFRKQAAAFITSASLEAGKLLRGEKVDGRLKNKLAALIEALRKQASPELRRALSAEQEAMLSFVKAE